MFEDMEKMMMKSVTIIGITMVMLLAANWARAEVCEIVNGSFEDDGWISDLQSKDPNGWVVDMSPVKFGGYVYTDWATDGIYSLTLYSDWAAFSVGDMATVSQDVNLVDVVRIAFDIKLDTGSAYAEWDPNICTAVLLIDGDVVWESNSVGSDVRGDYFDQVCVVPDKYRTEGLHKLSLGIRINVDELLWESYITRWDSVDCNLYCGGGGLLPGDIDRSCCVDANDLKLLADVWLAENLAPDDLSNLFGGDDYPGFATINFLDFALYANAWDGDMLDLEEFAEKWLAEGIEADDVHNLYLENDIPPHANINFLDFAVFADAWLGCSYPQGP